MTENQYNSGLVSNIMAQGLGEIILQEFFIPGYNQNPAVKFMKVMIGKDYSVNASS
jgi:hypothetical protein